MIQSWYSDMTCTFFSLWFGSRYLWLQELIFIGRGKLEIRIDHRTVSSLAGISTSRTSFKIHAECIVHFKLYIYFEQFCKNKLQCAYVCITASKVTLEMIWVFLKIELIRNNLFRSSGSWDIIELSFLEFEQVFNNYDYFIQAQILLTLLILHKQKISINQN